MLFQFDPHDLDAMRALMDQYGAQNAVFAGPNEHGEETTMSITRNNIMCETLQHNGWVRRNIYWRDGSSEEAFDGRWKMPNSET